VNYVDRLFFLSVFHVTNYDLCAYLETNLPANEIGPPIQPIGGLCSFDLFKVTKDMQVNEFEDLLQKPKETLDITFAEIKTPFTLLQPEIDFGAFKVDAGPKAYLYLDNIAETTSEKVYGFYGKIKQESKGKTLEMIPTLKHGLKFHRTNVNYHMFLALEIIKDSEDYEGCSGAPILDDDGNLVALACKVMTGYRVIY
jgi:hypothetical protein